MSSANTCTQKGHNASSGHIKTSLVVDTSVAASVHDLAVTASTVDVDRGTPSVQAVVHFQIVVPATGYHSSAKHRCFFARARVPTTRTYTPHVSVICTPVGVVGTLERIVVGHVRMV